MNYKLKSLAKLLFILVCLLTARCFAVGTNPIPNAQLSGASTFTGSLTGTSSSTLTLAGTTNLKSAINISAPATNFTITDPNSNGLILDFRYASNTVRFQNATRPDGGSFVFGDGAQSFVSAGYFSGSGQQLTSLNASNLTSGTVPSARGGAGNISGILKASAGVVSQAVVGTDYLSPSGSGAGLTGITASQVHALPTSNVLSSFGVNNGSGITINGAGAGTGDAMLTIVSDGFNASGGFLNGANYVASNVQFTSQLHTYRGGYGATMISFGAATNNNPYSIYKSSASTGNTVGALITWIDCFDVTNNAVTVNVHLVSSGTAPTFAIGAGAGGGASGSVGANSDDNAGTITITDAGTPAIGVQGTVTFNTNYLNIPIVIVQSTDSDSVSVKATGVTGNGFQIYAPAALATGAHKFSYIVIGK